MAALREAKTSRGADGLFADARVMKSPGRGVETHYEESQGGIGKYAAV
jgi:hypothetical protein